MMRIDLAGGLEPKPGYVNIDKFAVGAGVRADCTILPFADASVDDVNTSHYLEHLPKHHVVPQLREIYRVMRFGGTLSIEVPDLAWCCKQWILYQTNDIRMDMIFGDQSSDGQYHCTGFTRAIMYQYLEAAGFRGQCVSGDVFSHNQNCLQFTVEKG